MATPSAAVAAAPGVGYLCSSTDFSCLDGTGYSGQSVWGSWGPGHNCVSYAAFRLEQAGVARPWPDRIGSGFEWDDKARAAGVVVDTTPTVGSIAQWDNGSGHVAYVEAVDDTSIQVSEDNYPSSSSRRQIDRSSATFAAAEFIHVADVAPAVINRVLSGQIGSGALVNYGGHVYRIAGGAPLYVSTFDAVGGPQPTATLTDAEFGALRVTPADGTLVVGAQTGEYYTFAGSAPLYVSTFDAIGGVQPAVSVDQAALDMAGAGGVWDHASRRPVDGTLVFGAQTGQVYQFAGGAPIYVSTFDAIGGWRPPQSVDQAALDNAGAGGRWDHALFHPSDGTLLVGAQTGRVYVTRAGHPEYVWEWAQVGGPAATASADQVSIDNAGVSGPWSHLS